jgi:uncharacterized protein (TIGR03545 family)
VSEAVEVVTEKDTTPPRRTRFFRWQGGAFLLVLLALLVTWWIIFGELTVQRTLEEAATTSLGTQVDIGSLDLRVTEGVVSLSGVAVADPFDRTRNLIDAAASRIELEIEPLLAKKIVVRNVAVRGLRFGTTRAVPARPVDTAGFVPRALRELNRFREQINVPLLSLTPIDTLRALVLDPAQLRTVQSAIAFRDRADSLRTNLFGRADAITRTTVIDSGEALVGRLRDQTVRTLGVTGSSRALRDVRRLLNAVDSLRREADALRRDTETGFDSIVAATRAVNDARLADYAFARGLLRLPVFDAPGIGPALFGDVSITTFAKAHYWVSLGRQYAPPGLLPRQRPGGRRVRRPGTTVAFVDPGVLPDFLLRDANVLLSLGEEFGAAQGEYTLEIDNLTTAPSLLGRPVTFRLARAASQTTGPAIDVSGLLDHTGSTPRDLVNVRADDVKLPQFSLPGIPLSLVPGGAATRLSFELNGDTISATWSVRAASPQWRSDSARTRALNALESMVVDVIRRVRLLDVEAELTGTLSSPRLSVRSTIDRQVAAAVQDAMGETLREAEQMVRARVDSLADSALAPARAYIGEVRTQARARTNEVNARVQALREQLVERLRVLGGQA